MDLLSLGHDGVEVRRDALKGRCAHATRAFEVGDAILQRTPFATFGCAATWARCCNVCLAPRDSSNTEWTACQDCHLAAHCSKACLVADTWHSAECSAHARLVQICQQNGANGQVGSRTGFADGLPRLMLATRSLRAQATDGHAETQAQAVAQALGDMCHPEVHSNMCDQYEAAQLLLAVDSEKVLLPSALHRSSPTEAAAKIARCLAQVQVNNFTVCDNASFAHVAEACDPIVALINHSCEPNAVLVWECPTPLGQPIRVTLRCTRPLQAGEEVMIAYTDTGQPWWIRRRALESSHGFWCQCTFCKEIDSVSASCKGGSKLSRATGIIPRSIGSSIKSISDAAGKVMSFSLQGDAKLQELLQVGLGVPVAHNRREEAVIRMATELLAGLTDFQGRGPQLIGVKEARERFDKCLQASATLRQLLSPTHLFLRKLRGVALLADLCKDWEHCLSFAAAALRAYSERHSVLKADTLALQAKAEGHLALELPEACDRMPEAGTQPTGIDAAMLGCRRALAELEVLHGENFMLLPRAQELESLLGRLQKALQACAMPQVNVVCDLNILD